MDITKTESLLRQALDICRSVTGKPNVSDALLTEAFRHLQLEQEIGLDLDDEDTPPPNGLH